jgi:hypothetical protein
MERLGGVFLTAGGLILLAVLALTALAAGSAAALSAGAVLGLVCLAALMGALGLAGGLALGVIGGYLLRGRLPPERAELFVERPPLPDYTRGASYSTYTLPARSRRVPRRASARETALVEVVRRILR